MRKPANRPTKFTHKTVNTLLQGLRVGLPVHLACEAAGVAKSTFYEWQAGQLPRGADKQLKTEFLDALTRAKGEAALRNLSIITSAAKKDWRAAAWILERRYPQEFGKQSLELTGADGGPIEVQAVALQHVILKALERHPEARLEVAAALQQAHEGSDGA